MATSGTIKKPAAHIEHGEIVSGTVNSGSQKSFNITFDQAFDTAPTVVATVYSYTGVGADRVLETHSVTATTTSASITLYNLSTTNISLGTSRKITWIAAG